MQFEISFRLFVAEVFFSTFEMCLIVEKCAYCNYAQDTAKSVLYYAEHLCYSHCIRSIHAPVQLVQPDILNVAQHSNGIVLCGIRLLLFCCIPRRRYHFVCYQMAIDAKGRYVLYLSCGLQLEYCISNLKYAAAQHILCKSEFAVMICIFD